MNVYHYFFGLNITFVVTNYVEIKILHGCFELFQFCSHWIRRLEVTSHH